MKKLRDRVLVWLWPDLWYKLNTTFTEEEAELVERVAQQAFVLKKKEWRLMNEVRFKVNPLRQKFYDKEYSEKVKKEWGR